ncbi:polyphenol oxidase family protein [Bacillus aquiflavi]|uniref:polyphenol oxidase family protein n=1 Tax=Bacillus aquiflavi TaxID=2672567 RepID=UPI00293142EF|nr:polyphenol oxidase family protein [Bacillus aquiflavi]
MFLYIFFAPKQRALGIAHAGWRGSVSNISGEMIHCLKKEGIKEDEIFVVIGPSICEKCYIVDDLVISQIERNLAQGEERPYHEVKDGQYSLNLRSFNRQLLLKAGIPAENIETTNFCTSCHHQQFFSHRRDQGITGRMMSFIGWKEGNNK